MSGLKPKAKSLKTRFLQCKKAQNCIKVSQCEDDANGEECDNQFEIVEVEGRERLCFEGTEDEDFDRQLDNMKTWFSAMTVDKRMDVYKTLLDATNDSEDAIKEASEVVKLAQPKARVDFIVLLPEKVSMKILRYLDHRSLLAVELVSKAWNKLASDDKLWKRLCWQHINKKCRVCGLGMPMSAICSSEKNDKVVWKTVFYDRLRLEINWRKGKVEKTILPCRSPVTCLIATNRMIVSGHRDGIARVYCVRWACLHTEVVMHTDAITSLADDEKRIVSGSMDGTVKIWCLMTFKLVRTIQSQSQSVTSVCISPNWLVAGGNDGKISVWCFKTGTVFPLTGHTGAVHAVSIERDAIVSVAQDEFIRTWNLCKQGPLECAQGHNEPITGLSYLKCGGIATSSRDKTIKVWKAKCNGEMFLIHTCFGHEAPVLSLKMDNLRIVSGSEDHSVKVFDKCDGTYLYSLEGHNAPVDCISSKDSYIISGDRSGVLIYWNFAFDM